jgi:hypothetical protein
MEYHRAGDGEGSEQKPWREEVHDGESATVAGRSPAIGLRLLRLDICLRIIQVAAERDNVIH